jgi:uncharacterized membrane protein
MAKFKSRKFWMAVVSALLVVANDGLSLGLPAEAVLAVSGVAVSYILGQGLVDARRS